MSTWPDPVAEGLSKLVTGVCRAGLQGPRASPNLRDPLGRGRAGQDGPGDGSLPRLLV